MSVLKALRPRTALALAGVLLWLLLPLLLPGRVSVLLLIALYTPIVVGLSLLAGYTGQVSLGQAAFFGLGAYVTGILTVQWGLPLALAVAGALEVTGAVAYLIGAPVLMLRGHYLVIATLGVNIVFFVLMMQLQGLTGGANGLSGVPGLSLGGLAVVGDRGYFYAASGLMLLSLWLSGNLIRSRVGRALQAIESSETAAASLGVHAGRYKARIFTYAAVLAAASGSLYAMYVGFISPSPFAVTFSVELLVMSIVGGTVSVLGAFAGTAVVIAVQEALQGVLPLFAGAGSAEYEIVFFGAMLFAMVMYVPEGLLPWATERFRQAAGARWPEWSERLLPRRAPVPEPQPVELAPGARAGGALLAGEDLRRRFGGLVAVDGVSFAVRPGQVYAVIGPNGAGKTTLLNLVSGLIAPSAGRVRVRGRDVTGLGPHQVARAGIARTFQTPRLFRLLSVLDNVKVGFHVQQRSGLIAACLRLDAAEEAETGRRAAGILELLGIQHLADRPVTALSLGQQRRVELARALASRPRVLLLDEPASGLSRRERDELVRVITRIRGLGIAVVLVEHDVPLVMSAADRVLVMNRGRRIAEGAPAQVAADPEVIAAYLGTSAQPGTAAAGAAAGVDGDAGRAAGPALLELDGLRAGYGVIRVLHGLSLSVGHGEIVGVIGPNGAGKTTMTRAICGLIPARGTIRFEGEELRGLPPERVAARGLALVPERRELLPTMSVEDHLILGAYRRMGRISRAQLRAEVARVYERFPILGDRRRQRARSLSGGQQQMLAIARALMASPRLLVLDEPLLGLAPRIVERILAVLEHLREEGIGILLVEQNASTVLPMVNRAYLCKAGEVVLEGKSRDMLQAPELREAFLGA